MTMYRFRICLILAFIMIGCGSSSIISLFDSGCRTTKVVKNPSTGRSELKYVDCMSVEQRRKRTVKK